MSFKIGLLTHSLLFAILYNDTSSEAGKKALKWQKDAFEEKQQKLKAESTATAEAADMRAKQTSHKLEERNMMLERDLSIAQEELKRLESEKKLVKNRALAASENNSELTSVKRELRRSQVIFFFREERQSFASNTLNP